MSGVLKEERGDALWLRLNHPERLNAFDVDDAAEMVDALRSAGDAGAIVLTGTGRAFCAGGHLGSTASASNQAVRDLMYASLELVEAIRSNPRPVIAAVNGAAAGGGNELVIAADLAVAAASATFGQTGPRVGSSPVLGGTNVLAIIIGEKRAKEMSMLCRRYSAEEALALGFVNAVVSIEELEAATEALVKEVLALSPRYLEITKISSNYWWNQARESFMAGIGMLSQAVGSPDMREGPAAFLSKRPPNFQRRGAF